jgi:bifunctional non-homologous end joining protein LigD
MPEFIEPSLAVLAAEPPTSGEWGYEIKFDGYRMLARIDAGDVRIFTRNGHDWTARLPHLRSVLERLPVNRAWIDAEAVWFDTEGRPNFNGLQNAFDRRRTAGISLVVFDLMWLNNNDLRPWTWRERRATLTKLVAEILGDEVRFSEAIDADPDAMLASACALGQEGIMGKRVDAPYRSGRSDRWIKLKCSKRQEFVIGRFSRRKGATGACERFCSVCTRRADSCVTSDTSRRASRPARHGNSKTAFHPWAASARRSSARRNPKPIASSTG